MALDFNGLEEKYQAAVAQAATSEALAEAAQLLELVKLARLGAVAASSTDATPELDASERKFQLEVTVRRHGTNEVEGDSWFDPEDFAAFLRERFTIDRSASYGLDAYHKHSGQDVLAIEVKEPVESLRIVHRAADVVEVFLGGTLLGSATYHEVGSAGMFELQKAMSDLAEAVGLEVEEEMA